MIKVDENDPIGELEASFPYRDVQIKKGEDVKKYYDLEGELGRGKFGTVFKCREKGSKLTLAAKFIPIERRQDRKNVEREVEIMRTLQHPRLIQLYDAFESNNIMCVVLELIEGGELFERVIDDDFILTEKACTIFMRQICEGVEFVHRKNILHLDLKPENILCLTKTGNRIKIIDFGLARKYEPDKKLQVLFGTPEFVAPEVVNFDRISYATDMWSVGVICYVLLSGLSPFMGETDIETMSNVTLALYDFDDEAFDDISVDAKDFIAKLLMKNQAYRMTASQCLAHPWLQRKTPIKQVQCLEPTKENLRTYVENFTPHSGINFKNKTEDSTKMDAIQQIIESDKRNINQTILRSFRKDSLTNNDKEIISNDYTKHSIRPQLKIPCNDNLIENRNTLNDNSYTNEIYSEKPVRYKMTLTPLVKNMLPNNLLPLQENNSSCIFNSQVIPQKMIEDINGLELKETDKINIKSMANIQENQAIMNQKLTDKSKLMHQRSFNESIKSLSNLALISSTDTTSKQLRSNSIGNIDSGVKHRIIIPTIFGDNRTIKLINNKEFETPFTFNMGSNKVDVSKDGNNDIKWPEVLVKMMEKNDRFGKEFISNDFNNKPTHNVASISENNSLINNTVINYDRKIDDIKIDTKDSLSPNAFDCEHFLTFSPIVKGNESISHTDILNTIKSHGASSINSECKRLVVLPPTISINDKWKKEENSKTLQQNPFINTHRQLIDTKTNMERSTSFQSDASNQKDVFLKPKLKSTPPWFSEMQEKPKEKEITNVRRKFKFTSTHRDVPLDAPIKFDIERFIYTPNNSSNSKEVNILQRQSNIVEEISIRKSNYPASTDNNEHK